MVRHWIIGGVAVLVVAGAYFLGTRVSTPVTSGDSAPSQQGGLSAMLDRTLAAAGATSSPASAPAPASEPSAPAPTATGAPAPATDAGFSFATLAARTPSQTTNPQGLGKLLGSRLGCLSPLRARHTRRRNDVFICNRRAERRLQSRRRLQCTSTGFSPASWLPSRCWETSAMPISNRRARTTRCRSPRSHRLRLSRRRWRPTLR